MHFPYQINAYYNCHNTRGEETIDQVRKYKNYLQNRRVNVKFMGEGEKGSEVIDN